MFGKMMTPITAPVKMASKAVSTVAAPVAKALAPVGDVVGAIAEPVASIAGTVGTAAGVGAMFFPPLAGVAAGAEAVSTGASLAGSAAKMIDSDPTTSVGVGDVMGAMPLLGLFP